MPRAVTTCPRPLQVGQVVAAKVVAVVAVLTRSEQQALLQMVVMAPQVNRQALQVQQSHEQAVAVQVATQLTVLAVLVVAVLVVQAVA